MRKTVGVLGVLFQAIGLVVVGGQPAAAATPIPVMTSPRGEFQPAVGDGVLAWEENTKAHPSRFNVFVRAGSGKKTRVNARRTRGANGGIDGDLLVYQQYRGDSSNIHFFDTPDARRSKPPSGVNTKHWEYWPSVSNERLLFGRRKGNGDRKVILYNLESKNKKVLAKSTGHSRFLEPGQVNGDHVVWSKCPPSDKCDVFHHQISTGRTEKVPNPGNFQRAPSVAPDGSVYFVQSGRRCGASVRLMRYADGEFEKLTQLPDGNNITDTYAHVTGAGINEIYYANSACGSAYRSDIFKVVDRTGFTLNVVKGGSGQGSVTSTPGGIECGTTCSSVFSPDEQVTLSAQAVADSFFAGWSGGGCSGTETCTVTMDRARDVTATFELTSSLPTLTVTKDGSGTGTVTSNPAGISCGSDCTQAYDDDQAVTLTAVAGANSEFTGWSGGGCTGTGTCTVTMDASKVITATFQGPQMLTVTKDGAGTGTVISNPVGISCGSDCNESYPGGTTVTLAASPGANSDFGGWSGSGCTGIGTCTVTMDAAKTVTASFTPKFTLVVSKVGTGSGTVISNPSGINCGNDCDGTYAPGTVVTLNAFPATDSIFSGWSGACTGTETTCTVTVDQTKAVTATFTSHKLTVTRIGSGTGTVTSNPTGIDCGSTCEKSYTPGAVVVLTATPATGSSFAGWSGPCTGTGDCTVTMDAAKTVTATFETEKILTVTTTGNGTVTSDPVGINCGTGGTDCDETYEHGQQVTLTAAADLGWTFTGWGEDCTGTIPCDLTMNAAKNVTATFETEKTLTVTKTGNGTVTRDPAGVGCGADCTQYEHGQQVTLTATAGVGSTFAGWGGDCTGTTACDLTMDANKNVTATFSEDPPPSPPRQVMGSGGSRASRASWGFPAYLVLRGGSPAR